MHSWEELCYVYFNIWVIQLAYCSTPLANSHVVLQRATSKSCV